jgi:hypothetical protein
MKLFSFSIAVMAFAISAGFAEPAGLLYSENFSNTSNFPDSYTVSDGTEWVTNDAKEQNFVSENGVAYGFGDGSRVGILGYASPVGAGTSGISLLGTSVNRSGNSLLRFQVDQMISASSSTRPNDDTFGWTIRSGNNDLVRALFSPKTSGFVGSQNKDNTVTLGAFSLARNAVYRLQVWMDLNEGIYGVDVASLTTTGSPSLLSQASGFVRLQTGSLLNSSYENNISLNATWDLENKSTVDINGNYTSPGNNYMAFTNLKVENVPEPASGSMLLTALITWTLLRRRRS